VVLLLRAEGSQGPRPPPTTQPDGRGAGVYLHSHNAPIPTGLRDE